MAAITVRDLDDDTRRALKRRASAHNRSMEAEVRAILTDAVAVSGRGFASEWLEIAGSLRGEDLPLPPRSRARDADLFS